jgi:hypothetical protein
MKFSIRAVAFSLMILAALPTLAAAQALTDACKPAGGPFTITADRTFALTWAQPAPLGTIDGFSYALDGGAHVDFVPTSAGTVPCGADTAQAGSTPYLYQSTVTVPQGGHRITVFAYMFKRTVGADGSIVVDKTQRDEFASTDVPFVAAAPLPPAPGKPKNIKVWKK